MIEIKDIELFRDGNRLFHECSLTVFQGNKIAVIGANGCGKTTLFNLLLGNLHVDSGSISMPDKLVTAYVEQSTPHSFATALDFVIDGDREYRDLERDLAQAEKDNHGDKIAAVHDRLSSIGGYAIPARASELLYGLGFAPGTHSNPVTTFSGGWRMRLNLAKALMCRSDLLLLDEPTNHLDIEAVIWLEKWLARYQGTLLLISHDRDFIDSVCNGIAHIHNCDITFYSGNYSAYEKQRAEKLALQEAMHKKQQGKIKHLESFITRFKAKATKSKQAQSRIKALEKMELIAPAHVDSQFDFSFREPPKPSRPLLTLEDVSFGYDCGKNILEKVNLSIFPEERIGLLGENGAGKSTLIKLLSGEAEPLAGKVIRGQNLQIGYFAQHQIDQLDHEASPLLHIHRLDRTVSDQDILNFLGGFNFRGDKATAAIAPFSGGEKARLVLAMLVWQKPNLLLLDEPTNHLDLEMRHALTMALQNFSGTMVIVSHDRHLLKTTTEELLLVADKSINAFDGDLNGYHEWLSQKRVENNRDGAAETGNENSASGKKARRQVEAEKRKQLAPLNKKVKQLEEKIAKLEERLAEIETQLSAEETYAEDNKQLLKDLLSEQGKLKNDLEESEGAWMETQEQIESFELSD